MFTICLAFIIFVGTMFALQGRSLADNVKVFAGADLVILAPSRKVPLDEVRMNTSSTSRFGANRSVCCTR